MLCCYSDLTQILDTHLQQLLLMLEIGTAGDIIVCDLLFRAVLLLMSLPYGESPPRRSSRRWLPRTTYAFGSILLSSDMLGLEILTKPSSCRRDSLNNGVTATLPGVSISSKVEKVKCRLKISNLSKTQNNKRRRQLSILSCLESQA